MPCSLASGAPAFQVVSFRAAEGPFIAFADG